MPEGPDGKTIIIVKKVSGHGGHHGGAWKVAFADFVTAMMALFMVLWLVNSASVVTRERIASYFREPGVFEKGSGTPLEEGGAGILRDAFSPPAEGNSKVTTSKKIYKVDANQGERPDAFDASSGTDEGEVKDEPKPSDPDAETLAPEAKAGAQAGAQAKSGAKGKSAQDLKALIEQIKDLQNIEVKVDQRGLHIEIMDTDKASMFASGSADINPVAASALTKIAKILSALPNPIDIDGHTDGKPFNEGRREHYDNWNLSADRANAARRILLDGGIKEKQVARVVGYADQRLKVANDPMAPSNRRISISMRFTELAQKALDGTQTNVTESKPIGSANKKVEAPAPAPTPPPAVTAEPKEKPSLPLSALEAVPPGTPERNPGTLDNAKTTVNSNGIAVSVGTSKPEGEPLPPEQQDENSSWTEKDKIFGNKNPFFK